MNIDLLAGDNYILVNKKLAELFGLAEAVYLSELFNICKKAVNKKSFDTETGFFILQRKYIEKQITVSIVDQCKFDQKFVAAGFLEVDKENCDKIRIDLTKVVSIITGEDVQALTAISGAVKKNRAEGKRIGIINRLCSSLVETDPDIRQAYKDWIEACYGKITTVPQVKVFVEAVNNYTTDKDTKLALIKIGTANQYRELTWCVQVYEKSGGTKLKKTKISTGVNNDISF